MLERLLMHLHNWFVKDIYDGIFCIEGGSIDLPFLQIGQYYRIIGSVFNDGLHKYGDATDILTNETFDGAIWALAIPKQVIDLATEMKTWETNNASVRSPYESESFGGYSYAKAKGANGRTADCMSVFADRLNPWRKI